MAGWRVGRASALAARSVSRLRRVIVRNVGRVVTMEQEKVVVRRRSDGQSEEVGLLVSQTRDAYIVLTSSGQQLDLARGRELSTPRRGGPFHIRMLYPDRLVDLLRESPEALIDQVIFHLTESSRESPNANKIKSALLHLALPAKDVNKAWDDFRRRKLESPNVRITATKPPAYRWIGAEPPVSLLDLLGVTDQYPSTPATDGGPNESPPTGVLSVAPPAGRVTDSAANEQRLMSHAEPRSAKEAPDVAPAPRDAHQLSGSSSSFSSEGLSRRILTTALTMRDEGTVGIHELLSQGSEHDWLLAALMLASTNSEELAQVARGRLDHEGADHAVNAVLDELRALSPSRGKSLIPIAVRFLRNILADPTKDLLSPQVLFRLAWTPLLSDSEGALVVGADAVVSAAIRSLAGASANLETLLRAGRAGEWQQAARSISRLPLEREGSRQQFIARMYDVDPGVIRKEDWWINVDYQDLLALVDGEMATVLDDPVIGGRFVRPMVQAAVTRAKSVEEALAFAYAPKPLRRHVSGTTLRVALLRVVKQDSEDADWVQQMTGFDVEKSSLEKLEASERAARNLAAELEHVHVMFDEVQAQRDALIEQLRNATQATLMAREEHDRQVKLDILRTLASVSAAVKESGVAAKDRALAEQLAYLIRREGLEPIDDDLGTVPFDATRHDAMGTIVRPGDAVVVVRPGYFYVGGGDRVVLMKAGVTTET